MLAQFEAIASASASCTGTAHARAIEICCEHVHIVGILSFMK